MTVRPQVARDPQTSSPWALLTCLAGVVVCSAVIYTGHWRKGAMVFALSGLAAGLMRLFLPARWAGQLVVRAKWVDCLILLTSAVAVAVLVMVVPHSQPS